MTERHRIVATYDSLKPINRRSHGFPGSIFGVLIHINLQGNLLFLLTQQCESRYLLMLRIYYVGQQNGKTWREVR